MQASKTKSDNAPVAFAIARCKQGLLGVGAFSALMNLLLLTGPFFMLQVYDRVLTSRSLATLMGLAAIAMLLYLFYGAFDWTRARLLNRLSRAFDQSVANQSFDHATQGSYLSGAQSNKASGQTTADLKELQRFISSPAMGTIFDIPWFPVYLAVIFLLHPSLGLLASFGALALVIVAICNQVISRDLNARALLHTNEEDKLAMASQVQSESLSAMGMLGDIRRLWRHQHDARLELQSAAADRQALFASISKTLRLVLQSAMLGYGAYLVIGNEVSAGALIASSIIFARALAPLDQTISQWRVISAAHAAYQRLRETLVKPAGELFATDLPRPKLNMTVSDLSVAEPSQESVLISDVSFDLSAGDALGIIGPSGGGKSSLIKGLIGLWPATAGDTRFDGATIDQWAPHRRGEVVGYLPQFLELFPGTIAQNIARFQPEAQSEAVLEATRLARVHELIVGLPDGFDTVVGPGGHALSGGERQRIALARAVYGMPFLVVLDEPNANMDSSGELALAETIRALRKRGSIVIVATHRKSVLSEVNKLMLIEDRQQILFGDTQYVLGEIGKRHKARKSMAERRGGLRVVS